MKEETNVLFPNETVSVAVFKYCKERSVPLPDHIQKHADLTEKDFADLSEMMVSRLQAQYLIWTARSYGAKKILEIGCFTGFSALTFAEALKDVEGAKIITTDINPETTKVARQAFKDAGIDHFVSLIEGPAQESIENLGGEAPFDMIFLDANKDGYPQYFKTILDLKLLRKGGILIADNVLKRGLVAEDKSNPGAEDPIAVTRVTPLREFNDLIAKDPRVETFILPVFDGLALVRVL
ncbi:hypothetical protein H072_8532 [Dactylellina haptotyla CBS 200.50]|uniref:O-methyltransferase n=1 Tax=Dactylellina haptotyla (strain CBS 200.50) TaxID=1284197 RepID=S8A4L5_DACHA|nr:hypothetical protein H072_8532 [Dactylellina haptotyla CBS 200.50]